MGDQPGLRPDRAVGEALAAFAGDILADARRALEQPQNADAVAVHDFRKAMKRWRALLRLLQPSIGEEAYRLRIAARDLARALAPARDGQSALDALADLGTADTGLSPRSLAAIGARLQAVKQAAETTTLTDLLRARIAAALAAAEEAVARWPLDDVGFDAAADGLADAYARARRLIPADWEAASPEELHDLRQRVVVHRYQMDLVQPLWPRLGKLWVGEAQRLRDRLGTHQDLTVLAGLTAAHQPLAPWRSRLVPPVARRQAAHARAAARLAARLFAERPKAFRRRLEALWDSREGGG